MDSMEGVAGAAGDWARTHGSSCARRQTESTIGSLMTPTEVAGIEWLDSAPLQRVLLLEERK